MEHTKITFTTLDIIAANERMIEKGRFEKKEQIIDYTKKYYNNNSKEIQEKYNSDNNRPELTLFRELNTGIEQLIDMFDNIYAKKTTIESLKNNLFAYNWIICRKENEEETNIPQVTLNSEGKRVINGWREHWEKYDSAKLAEYRDKIKSEPRGLKARIYNYLKERETKKS
jgi:hypothetical protein